MGDGLGAVVGGETGGGVGNVMVSDVGDGVSGGMGAGVAAHGVAADAGAGHGCCREQWTPDE